MKADGQVILNKYITLPERLQEEVVDFIDFLMFMQQRQDGKRKKKESNFGSARGLIVIKNDFDQPLEDFKEYMFGNLLKIGKMRWRTLKLLLPGCQKISILSINMKKNLE